MIRIPLKRGLSYNDVLLKPLKSSVTDLSNVDVSTSVAGIELDKPVISAPMDTVTEGEMAKKMGERGGLGVIHRFLSTEEQARQAERVSKNADVAAAIGLGDRGRADALVDAGCDALVLDIAHGHHEKMLEEVEYYASSFETAIIAGNVATSEGARELESAGADAVKVGIGPGSACTTREIAGAGVPQFTAVKNCAEAVDIDVIADGGIRKPGDLVTALMAGASTGMIGGMFAGTDETPGEIIEEEGEKYKIYRGMSTEEAAMKRGEREDREISYEDMISEGIVTRTSYKGSVEKVLKRLVGGLRSGISYCSADNLEDARKNAEFMEISASTQARNGGHITGM